MSRKHTAKKHGANPDERAPHTESVDDSWGLACPLAF